MAGKGIAMGGEAQDRSPGEAASGLPDWVPQRIRLYIAHTKDGRSLRALARDRGLNPSTVLRHVRRYEERRDDPLMDGALSALGQGDARLPPAATGSAGASPVMPDERLLRLEGRRLLHRLAEPGAVLAFSPAMEKAVIMRTLPDGASARTAVLDRAVAQAFSLKEWVRCRKAGRVSTYEISAAGRAELRRMEVRSGGEDTGRFAEGMAPFAGMRPWTGGGAIDDAGPRRGRRAAFESPIAILGRRRDRDGRPFLGPELVKAAERLREDFELARMGADTRGECGLPSGAPRHPAGTGPGPACRARERMEEALRDLGPGLGDVALRVCCHLEGIESAEREMGWAARSGKIVLRIALMRLCQHYDETCGRAGPLIG